MPFLTTRLMRPLTATMCSAALVLGATTAVQAEEPQLPDTMTWSSYDVGSAGYAEASAIADAFGKEYGTRIRIQPSGSAIGRLQPLLSGRADVGFLATETFFAAEGVYDFSTRQWGPQDLRAIAGRHCDDISRRHACFFEKLQFLKIRAVQRHF